jgi:alpha-D-ribose 1-methylphosphonate 5-triphosphate synthase subunit PhnG
MSCAIPAANEDAIWQSSEHFVTTMHAVGADRSAITDAHFQDCKDQCEYEAKSIHSSATSLNTHSPKSEEEECAPKYPSY